MKIDIIVVYLQRYKTGHEVNFVPPITGIHLAAITPDKHKVRVPHQQVEKVDLNSDADLIALSFFSGFVPEAYRLAGIFKQKGKTVVAGGPHVTYNVEEALQHVDAVITGEAESAWSELLDDLEKGGLKNCYHGSACDMKDLPHLRYDDMEIRTIQMKYTFREQANSNLPKSTRIQFH